MPWCNGSVALVGNSWLAIAQWFIAAERPPHLKCIAPFEGASDAYRESLCRGGVPQPQFSAFVRHQLVGTLIVDPYYTSILIDAKVAANRRMSLGCLQSIPMSTNTGKTREQTLAVSTYRHSYLLAIRQCCIR